MTIAETEALGNVVYLRELFNIQRGLQNKVNEEHPVDLLENLDKVALATIVEVCECANEWRGFKFWSKNQKPNQKAVRTPTMMEEDKVYYNPLLEEYVDGLHFILLLGLIVKADGRYGDLIFNSDKLAARTLKKTDKQFLKIISLIQDLASTKHYIEWKGVFEYYMGLGKMLNFGPMEIVGAYFEKNKINHKRQETGY